MNDETKPSPRPESASLEQRPQTADTATGHFPQYPSETLAQSPEDQARNAAALSSQTTAPKVTVPGFEIITVLGRGGMGVVYKARQVTLNRIVAIKMILHGEHADPSELGRFRTEAEAIAAIHHTHVVQIHELGEHDGRPFMVMECLEGDSLDKHLRQIGKFAPQLAAEMISKIARGIQAAHDLGIIHRDLKPGNVLRTESGEPKVTDFGLARRAGGNLTQSGAVMGTPKYMAPEQARGDTSSVCPATDVYALGAILYECLTGAPPFTGSDALIIMDQVLKTEPQKLRRIVSNVPYDLELICLKCLEKAPAARYPDAAALADDLDRFLKGQPILARAGVWYSIRKRAKKYTRPALATVGVLLFVALSGWGLKVLGDRENNRLRRGEVMRRVESILRAEPLPDRVSTHHTVTQDRMPNPDMSGLVMLEDRRVYDLRGWRVLEEGAAPMNSYMISVSTQRLQKIGPKDVHYIKASTSGKDVVLRALEPRSDRSTFYALKDTELNGRDVMKNRQVSFDLSAISLYEEFTLQVKATYWDNCQTEEDRWVGAVGYEGSQLTSFLMIFSQDRPCRGYELLVARLGEQNDPTPYKGHRIVYEAEDRTWLYWEIPSPKPGHVYRVKWK